MRVLLVTGLIVLLTIAAGLARSERELKMIEPIRVTLILEQAEIIRGESVYFRVIIENTSSEVIEDAPALTMHGQALTIHAESPDTDVSCTEKDILAREGGYSHGPRRPPTTKIPPKGKLERRDDLLRWMGELPPGSYNITASYESPEGTITSSPVPLKILPADPVAIESARPGDRLGSAELGAAWTHKLPPAAGGGFLVFYQQQNQNLPRSPVHGVRVTKVQDPVQPLSATTAGPAVAAGWIVWSDARQRLNVAKSNLSKPAPMDPVQIRTPYAGAPQASPLARQNGGLLIPFTDAGKTKASIITISPEGAIGSVDLPLGAGSPMGPAAWQWYREYRLDAVWAKPNGREILTSRVPLDDLGAGFSTPITIPVDDPVIWLDGYYDEAGARARHTGEGEAPPPDTMAWAVLRRAKSVAVARVNLTLRIARVEWSVDTKDDTPVEPLCSAVNKNHDLTLLLKSPRGHIMFLSTASKRYCTLREATGIEITPAQQPSLMAAGADGTRAWVYMRYIDRAKNRIAYAKVETVEDRDPMEPRPPEPKRLEQPGDWGPAEQK